MKTILVSYDLRTPETSADYKKLHEYLQGFSRWAKPLYSQYLIVTEKTVSTVLDEVESLVDNNDKVLVLDVSGSGWATINLGAKVNEWMKVNI